MKYDYSGAQALQTAGSRVKEAIDFMPKFNEAIKISESLTGYNLGGACAKFRSVNKENVYLPNLALGLLSKIEPQDSGSPDWKKLKITKASLGDLEKDNPNITIKNIFTRDATVNNNRVGDLLRNGWKDYSMGLARIIHWIQMTKK